MATEKKYRVLVVDGAPLERFAIATLTNLHPLMEVCAEAGDGAEARRLCEEVKPDVVLLDLVFPRGDGVTFIREMRRLHAPARAVVVSGRADESSVRRAFHAGAAAYVMKDEAQQEVNAALDAAVSGGLFASKRVSHIVLSSLQGKLSRQRSNDLDQLSDREMHVFRLTGSGLGTTAIGREMGVSVKTVETHQQRIKWKLGITTCAELQVLAARAVYRDAAR